MKQSLQRFIITLIGVLSIQYSIFSQQKIIGYYESWLNLPAVSDMEFNNLTHVIQAFAWPDSDGSIGMDYGVPNAELIKAVHSANEKILISFVNDSTDSFGRISADSSLKAVFISNVVQLLKVNQYDGIDIDWEFPAAGQSSLLTGLVKALRQKFNAVDSTWLITMAIPPNAVNGIYFDYSGMLPDIDWYNVMGYNYFGSWSAFTGHNAPLYAAPRHNDGDDSSSIKYLETSRQIPAAKLVLGIPFYGIEFNSKGLYETFTGSVTDPIYTDIANFSASREWVYHWDTVSAVPYYLKSDSTIFISFDDTASVKLKTEFSISNKLGGVMIWALDQDIVNGRQPLLEAIGKTVHNNVTAVTSGGNEGRTAIHGFYLYNNYPNPFNPSTIISWQLASGSFVTLKIYDILGNEVAFLVNEFQPAGFHSVSFNAQQAGIRRQLSSGIYFYKLQAGSFVQTKKLLFMK
jgi:chitinase